MNQPIGIPSGWEIIAAAFKSPIAWAISYVINTAPGSMTGWKDFDGYDWREEP